MLARLDPRLDHVRNWIFDLDNTLYPASADLFAQVDARMTGFIQDLLGLEHDEARRVQKGYFHNHGTTLSGLMAAMAPWILFLRPWMASPSPFISAS